MRTATMGVLAVLAGCAASGGRLTDEERLGVYRASAGDPVTSFRIEGGVNQWTGLGDRHLAVQTGGRAYLLELGAPCPDLGNALSIALMHNEQRVEAGFDGVIVRGPSVTVERAPCMIATIRPVDTERVELAEQELKQAEMVERRAAP